MFTFWSIAQLIWCIEIREYQNFPQPPRKKNTAVQLSLDDQSQRTLNSLNRNFCLISLGSSLSRCFLPSEDLPIYDSELYSATIAFPEYFFPSQLHTFPSSTSSLLVRPFKICCSVKPAPPSNYNFLSWAPPSVRLHHKCPGLHYQVNWSNFQFLHWAAR